MPEAERFAYWQSMLKQHGAALSAYGNAGADSAQIVSDAQNALRFAADHLAVIWD